MGWFNRKSRCRACGQFARSWHRCPNAGRRAPSGIPMASSRSKYQQDKVDVWVGIARAAEAFEAKRASNGLTVWDHRPGNRGQKLIVPTPQSLTKESREIFHRGHCHSLALAFAEKGYAVRGVVSVHTLPEFVAAKTVHYFAVDKTDPTYGWDAYGRRPIEEIAAAYSNVRVYEIKDASSQIAESVESETYLPTNIEAGRAFAVMLLTE